MIKYFSQILSKFSIKQRITALIILSIVFIIITLGPIIIKTLDPGTKDLKIRIDNQDKEIIRLNKYIDTTNIKIYSLNQTIIQNQEECTNRVVQREQEITKMIDNMINKKLKTKQVTVYNSENNIVGSYAPNQSSEISEPKVMKKMMVKPHIETNNDLITDLIQLKKKIKKH